MSTVRRKRVNGLQCQTTLGTHTWKPEVIGSSQVADLGDFKSPEMAKNGRTSQPLKQSCDCESPFERSYLQPPCDWLNQAEYSAKRIQRLPSKTLPWSRLLLLKILKLLFKSLEDSSSQLEEDFVFLIDRNLWLDGAAWLCLTFGLVNFYENELYLILHFWFFFKFHYWFDLIWFFFFFFFFFFFKI